MKYINEKLRGEVYNKFNGKCAYTGKELGDDWQIDHAYSKRINEITLKFDDINHIDNLLPTLKIVNHYKRALDLEMFRKYMLSFHIRLSKLPKYPKVEKSIKHKHYMNNIATAFDIDVNKPFNGKFYFELI